MAVQALWLDAYDTTPERAKVGSRHVVAVLEVGGHGGPAGAVGQLELLAGGALLGEGLDLEGSLPQPHVGHHHLLTHLPVWSQPNVCVSLQAPVLCIPAS